MKIPLIMQIQVSDNGGAALAMMLGYFGKNVTLQEMRTRCVSSRNGSNVGQVCAAADAYGLDAQVLSLPAEALRQQKLPLLICWKKKYYAVLTRLTDRTATLLDPAKGQTTVTMEKFVAQYTGRAIALTPRADFVPGGKLPNTFSMLRERLRGYEKWLLLLSGFSAAGVLLSMVYLDFKKKLIDDVMSGAKPETLTVLAAAMLAIVLLRFLISTAGTLVNARVSRRMAARSGAAIYKKLVRLPLSFFEKVSRGEIMERLERNASIDRSLLTTLAPKMFNAFALCFYLILIYRYNALLSTVLIGVHLLISLAMLLLQKRIVTVNRSILSTGESVRASMMAALNTIDSIKASGSERQFFQIWNDQMNESLRSGQSALGLDSAYSMLETLQSVAESAVLLILGAYLIIYGHLTMGMLASVSSVFSSISSTMTNMLSTTRQMQTMRTGLERINDLMTQDSIPEVPLPPDAAPDKLSGGVRAEHLTYRYNEGDEAVLHDVSLTIAPGELVALVGASGCGKSTLMKLLSGMYQVQQGSITYDGMTRAEIPDTVFYSSVGCVDQEINMFADTVRANLKMWDPTVEDFEMVLAARDAQIHERILQNPQGYDSLIAGNGRNYSGGEQQRLELARALSSEATLLFLDEFTSALDALTEDRVFRAIRDKRTTCLIAAHRLSTIVGCDRIIVMEAGNIVEMGTHEELFAAGGLYSRLIELQ